MNVHGHWRTKSPPICLGHRGFPEAARENTPESFAAALAAGAQGVELDVHLTRDGVPVVHHDPTARTEDREVALERTPWEELARLTFVAAGASYAVASLEGVLAGLDPAALVNVEIKPPPNGDVSEAASATLRVIQNRPGILVSSFSGAVLAALAEMPGCPPLAFLFSRSRDLSGCPDVPLLAWNPRYSCVDEELVRGARSRKLKVFPWTVDDVETVRFFLDLGVDGIITNRPDLMAPLCSG